MDESIIVVIHPQAIDIDEIFLIPVISRGSHDLISAGTFGVLGWGRGVFVRLVDGLKPCGE